jgi:hypothetical protein
VEILEGAAVFLSTGLMAASSAASATEPVWDLTGSEDVQTVDHLLVKNKHKRITTKFVTNFSMVTPATV